MCIEESLGNKNVFQQLYNICMQAAQEEYGTPISSFVLNRVKYELKCIKKIDYASYYLRTIKLVDKARSLGYKYGAVGTESASLVAYFCKITNINPLPPHYYCSSCHLMVNPDEQIKRYWTVAYDLPDKICEKCGKQMIKSGFNIPFESFWGIDGEKNKYAYFSFVFADYLRDVIMNDYQNYNHGINIVESIGNEDGVLSDLLVEDTHIKQRVYVNKYLSILHDLEELTGVNMDDISYCDSQIIELFDSKKLQNEECLPLLFNVSSWQILSRYTLNKFSDLLSAWALICDTSPWMTRKNKKCFSMPCESINELIGIRENVMLYLLEHNISFEHAYYIMEDVRRGKGLNAYLVKALYDADIPDCYIESWDKYRYMRPKASVITDVKIAWCMAYYKRYYPDSFYVVLEKHHLIGDKVNKRGKKIHYNT
ncbi:hypothetical protein [Selenomonas sp. FC4001]|uniref:hypothetical protein n=1 Tax=Selenomonas sp. FC4001 TaxID=1408313 RepID=UPI000A7DF319|nr:hypothetical protein [Selenomonas sp. FC4001]